MRGNENEEWKMKGAEGGARELCFLGHGGVGGVPGMGREFGLAWCWSSGGVEKSRAVDG